MNTILTGIIDKTAPKFNPDVVNGTAKKVLKGIPEFLDEIFRSSMASLNPTVNLQYRGYRRLTPKEEFNRMLLNKNNKTTYDLAESDLYMVEFIFNYNGLDIRKPLYLPFAGDGNIMRISNTPYVIVPVLSDTVISPSYKEVFVRLLKDKITMQGQLRAFMVNNEKVPGQVIYSKIIKGRPPTDKIGKPVTPMSLYLLGKYGFAMCLKKYCKIDEFIVTKDNVDALRETYNVYESTGVKPKNLLTPGYIAPELKVCIPKKYEVTPFLENFLFGMLYVFDTLPKTVDDFLNAINGRMIDDRFYPPNLKDEIHEHWRIILGRLAYMDSYSRHRIVADMREHFDTLENYVDTLIKTKLRDTDIHVDNFYDMTVVIMSNFNMWLLNSKEYNSDIANRYIDVLYYIMYDIIIGFNKIILSINKRASKKVVSDKEIATIINDELPTKKIFNLIKSNGVNLAVAAADYNADIMYAKCTALFEDQLVFIYLTAGTPI